MNVLESASLFWVAPPKQKVWLARINEKAFVEPAKTDFAAKGQAKFSLQGPGTKLASGQPAGPGP